MKTNITPLLRKHLPELLDAKKNNLSEADTSVRVLRVLGQVLGYDEINEITHEVAIKSRFADMAVKIDGTMRFIVELKSGGTKLALRFVDQSNWYAANRNIQWVLLTNGVDWNLYHLTWNDGIQSDVVFTITLASETLSKSAESLALLHRSSVKSGQHEAFWKKKIALSAASVGQFIFSEDMMRLIRRKFWQRDKISMDLNDVAEAVYSLFSDDVKQKIGSPRIRQAKPAPKAQPSVATAPPAPPPSTAMQPSPPS